MPLDNDMIKYVRDDLLDMLKGVPASSNWSLIVESKRIQNLIDQLDTRLTK